MIDRFSRKFLSAMAVPLCVALASCGGDKTAETGTVQGEVVAAVPAPDGTSWSDRIAKTDQGGYLMGNPDAPIKLVEYGALSCSHCADFAGTAMDPIRSEYVDSGRVSYELRLVLLNAMDVPSGLLVQCSSPEAVIALSEQFWANQGEFYTKAQQAGDQAFQQVGSLPEDKRLVAMAELFGMIDFFAQRGISRDQATACLSDTKAAQAFVERGQSYGVDSTPTLEINGTRLTTSPTWEALEPELQRAGAR